MELNPVELRNALGRFATGVCVITADPAGMPAFGMTVNSFASLSLDPPLVLWSLQKTSDCRAGFDAAERYCVNVLSVDQKDLSGRFARKNDHAMRDGDGWFAGETGLPVLEGCLVSFECTIQDRFDGGDHIILVGRVVAMHHGDATEPLLFFGGAYNSLAK